MNRERQIKVLSIIALVMAIMGMSLGFAAFSTSLNISSSASVTPNSEDFSMVLSGSAGDPYVSEVPPIVTGGATASAATVEGSILKNINASFTSPGQSVTFYGYLHNTGKYTVYLKTLIFNKVSGHDVKKVCTAVDPANTSADLLAQACEGIHLTVTTSYGDYTYTYRDTNIFGSYNDIGVGTVSPGTTTITYDENAVQADGPFIVEFGDLVYEFSSAR